MSNVQNMREVSSRIEGLLQDLRDVSDPRVVDKTEHLVRLLMEFYGAGLEHIMTALRDDETLLKELVDDPLETYELREKPRT